MIQQTTTRTRPLATALAVMLIALVMLVLGAQGAAAQENVTWELGDFCLDDYANNSTCTANDVRIASITPSVEEACLTVGDTATVKFQVRLDSGANERYDVSVFVATDGGSAWTGNECYHDFLQPVSTDPTLINVLSGDGYFWELESTHDMCGDIRQNEPTYYNFQQELTIACVDNNGDGAVDPISTCTGWHNNAKNDCLTVKGADIDVPSKCTCEYMDPGIRVYRGYDWGDLLDSYKTLTASDGARHSIQDTNKDNTPDTITYDSDPGAAVVLVTVPAVWLGPLVDYSPDAETDGQPTGDATGDDADTKLVDDEDGVLNQYPAWGVGANGASVQVTVSSSNNTCANCQLGFWIDWNQDGDFDDDDEDYVVPVSIGSQTVYFATPWSTPLTTEQTFAARFRLYDGYYAGPISSSGLVVNGEVEDYYFTVPANPTAVEVSDFTATGDKRAVTLEWKVNGPEILGFNVYRAKKVDGAKTKVNADLITDGSLGTPWLYTDSTVLGARSYYYWLEAVDIYGNSTMVGGPVEVRAKKVKFELSVEAPVQ